MRLSPEAVSQIATMTDGFSFAYLKELLLSSMIRWVVEMTNTKIEEILVSQIAILQEQINSVTTNSEGRKELETDKK